MDTVRIIVATREHLDKIVRIEAALFPVEPFSRRVYRYLIDCPNAIVLVCMRDGEIIGHGVALNRLLRNGKNQGRIYSIGILGEYRRRGYAGFLLRALEQRLQDRGVAFISLETHRGHAGVISFYTKHGYARAKVLPGYYEDGDGIGMRKDVPMGAPE